MIFMQVKSLESRVLSLSLKTPFEKVISSQHTCSYCCSVMIKTVPNRTKNKTKCIRHTSRYFSLHHMLLACTISLTGEIGQAAINTVTLSDARLNSTVTASCKHVDTYLNYSQQSAGAAWCGHTGIQCTPHKHNDWRRSGRFLSTGGTAAQMQWK